MSALQNLQSFLVNSGIKNNVELKHKYVKFVDPVYSTICHTFIFTTFLGMFFTGIIADYNNFNSYLSYLVYGVLVYTFFKTADTIADFFVKISKKKRDLMKAYNESNKNVSDLLLDEQFQVELFKKIYKAYPDLDSKSSRNLIKQKVYDLKTYFVKEDNVVKKEAQIETINTLFELIDADVVREEQANKEQLFMNKVKDTELEMEVGNTNLGQFL